MSKTTVYRCWNASLKGEPITDDMFLNTGLGGVDGHPQCGMWKKKEGGGYKDGAKQDHRWVPVRIWLENDEGQMVHEWQDGLTIKAVVGKDQTVDPVEIWGWCMSRGHKGDVLSYNAIKQADYKAWLETGRWPDDVPERQVGIGHNAANDDEDIHAALAREVEAERQRVEAWVSDPHEGETAANMASNWLAELRKLERRAKEAFETEKEPHLEAGRRVDIKWKPIRVMAEAIKERMSATFAEIARKEKARKQAIADREAQAKAAAIRAKQEAERQAMERMAEAQQIELPPPPPPPVVVAEKVKASFGGASSSKIGLKEYRVAVVEDWKAATLHYAESPKVREIIQKLANADAKNGVKVPGVRIAVEERV